VAQQATPRNLVSADVAGALNDVSPETLRRLYRVGKVPGYKVGRLLKFDPVEIRETFRSVPKSEPRTLVGPDFDAIAATP
jgi:hypothetical protein